MVIGLLKFSVSSWVSLGRLYFLRKWSISSGLSYLLAYNFSSYSLIILCISVVSVVIFSFLISDSVYVCRLSFFLGKSLWGFIYFVYFLEEPALAFIDSIVLFFSILFIYALIFIMSLLLLTLGLICSSFSSFINCEFRVLIWDCSSFLR